MIDYFALAVGYAVSGGPTLEAFYKRLKPYGSAFMALFSRKALPHRSTLSRFLAAIDPTTYPNLPTNLRESPTRVLMIMMYRQ